MLPQALGPVRILIAKQAVSERLPLFLLEYLIQSKDLEAYETLFYGVSHRSKHPNAVMVDHQAPTAEAVLSLPELLEAIILQLPLNDIITIAARVSRVWHAMVSSPKVRQKLGFPLKTPQTVISPRFGMHGSVAGLPEPVYAQTISLNPLLHGTKFARGGRKLQFRDGQSEHDIYRRSGYREYYIGAHLSTPYDGSVKTWLEDDRPSITEGSIWRQMYLTYPPCTSLFVKTSYRRHRGDDPYRPCYDFADMVVYDPNGIKCGKFVDTIFMASKDIKNWDSCYMESIVGVRFAVIWLDPFLEGEIDERDFDVCRPEDNESWRDEDSRESESDDEVSSDALMSEDELLGLMTDREGSSEL